MPIFKISKEVLTLISEKEVSLEKDIQNLVQKNLQSIFGLEFVVSEIMLNDLRIDTLAYDKESTSFVIIEYKRDKNFSVIDQGYAYLGLLLNNKSEFILTFNENSKTKILKKNDVDWSQSKIIFVSPSFTTYQRKAIEFRDLPIELWEVKLYSNDTILFNKITAPEKSESIKTVSQKSEVIRNVSKEVTVYTEESHIQEKPEPIVRLYNELKENILAIGHDINLKPKKMYIAFTRKTNFVDVVLRNSDLNIFLNLKYGMLNDPRNISRNISKIGHWGNGDYEIKLKDSKDLGYILSLIRQAYDKN